VHVDEATKACASATRTAKRYVYYEDETGRRITMHRLTRDEARGIAPRSISSSCWRYCGTQCARIVAVSGLKERSPAEERFA
jgi:hypothetical protein